MTATPTLTMSMLDIDQIHPHPRNVRAEVTGLGKLIASIAEQGVLQPLVVAPATDRAGYVLIAGHRRHAAAEEAGLTELPCVIRDDLGAEVDQIQAMLTENLQRCDLNVIEEGDAYQALLDLDVNVKTIAKIAGRTAKLVKERVKVAKAPEQIRTRLAAREITLEVAMVLQQYADDQELCDYLDKYIGTANWAFAIAQTKRQKARKTALAKVAAELRAAGITVCVTTDDANDYRATQAKARGENLLVAALGPDRPDDATSPDVYASFEFQDPARLRWHRLVTEAAVDAADALADTALGAVAATKQRAQDRERAQVEAEQKKEDVARIAEGLKTAAIVRRQHLADALGDADDSMARACLHAELAATLEHHGIRELEIIADVLGIEHGEDTDWDEMDTRILSRVQTMNTTRLAVLVHIVSRAPREVVLELPSAWRPDNYARDAHDAWRITLGTTFGYEWSDIENELLDRLAENPAE